MTAKSKTVRQPPRAVASTGHAAGDASSRPIRILLADDHHVVRQGLAAILATEPDLQVVGEACDGEAACRLYRELRPDVLVLDLRMPVLDGFEVVRRLVAEDRNARILILTTYDTDEDVWRSLRAGAKGYLLKDATHADIVHAVRTVAAGNTFTTPQVAGKLVRRAQLPELSARERDVLRELAKGGTNKEIALALGIGGGTVKSHLKSLLAKLGATTRTAAVRRARERGLLS